MAKKQWRLEEFSIKVGVITAINRETLARKVLDFLNEHKLKPSECIITCHTEQEDAVATTLVTKIVFQVFYYGSSL